MKSTSLWTLLGPLLLTHKGPSALMTTTSGIFESGYYECMIFYKKKKDATYRWKMYKVDSLAISHIIFQMGKMTPRRARALPDHLGWPIASYSCRLPSAICSPQRQCSGDIPEQEEQESESMAF